MPLDQQLAAEEIRAQKLAHGAAQAICAGVPLSLLVQRYGWDAFFATMIGASGVALLLLMPLMNAKSFVQRDADAIKRLQAAANA